MLIYQPCYITINMSLPPQYCIHSPWTYLWSVSLSVCLYVRKPARLSLFLSFVLSIPSLSLSLSLCLLYSLSLSLFLSLSPLSTLYLSLSLSLSLSFSLSFALCLRQSLCAYVTYTNHRHFDTIRIIILTTSSYPLKVRWILS